jgi:copper chaperone NosL
MKRILFHTVFLVMIASHSAPHALSAENSSAGALEVGKKDLCPVCGMFVYKYPNWVSQITFHDRTYAFFDGAKDMFKYLLDLSKYNPKKTVNEILSIWVTDYYTTTPIDGKEAYYVVGSDVLGPMGRELIPHKNEKAAASFAKDHGGQRILRFNEIDLNVVQSLR